MAPKKIKARPSAGANPNIPGISPTAQLPSISPLSLLIWLYILRLYNALNIETFFQPDEYFQALEPAWAAAFGENSGAWITWVRRALESVYLDPVLRYHLTGMAGTSPLIPASPPVHRRVQGRRILL